MFKACIVVLFNSNGTSKEGMPMNRVQSWTKRLPWLMLLVWFAGLVAISFTSDDQVVASYELWQRKLGFWTILCIIAGGGLAFLLFRLELRQIRRRK